MTSPCRSHGGWRRNWWDWCCHFLHNTLQHMFTQLSLWVSLNWLVSPMKKPWRRWTPLSMLSHSTSQLFHLLFQPKHPGLLRIFATLVPHVDMSRTLITMTPPDPSLPRHIQVTNAAFARFTFPALLTHWPRWERWQLNTFIITRWWGSCWYHGSIWSGSTFHWCEHHTFILFWGFGRLDRSTPSIPR